MSGDIAIVGMACHFPAAPNLQTFWENVLSKVDAVTDPPDDWEGLRRGDSSSSLSERIYCKRGGFLRDVTFDPIAFGIMPNAIDGADPDHFLGLAVTADALADADCLDRAKRSGTTEIIVGRGTYMNRANVTALHHCLVIDDVVDLLRARTGRLDAHESEELKRELTASLPPFTPETAIGLIPNLLTGRIAHRFDLVGPNYTIDAACASSLVATELGMRDLAAGRCDLALVGGANVTAAATLYMVFCRLNALSRRGCIRPFDRDADGTVLGEGFGMLVLKRRDDAERDGDRIYAVIKAVGLSSDGHTATVLSPNADGEERAMRRAYAEAAVDPASVDLVEAHGTATPLGDAAEIDAMTRVFCDRGRSLPCAVGSVKSMIGHLLAGAGVAGLIKTALALHHKVLPPTLHCDHPHPALPRDGSLFLNTRATPWIHGRSTPRRAGVSAFGFGGINAHAVLEESSCE